MRSAQRSVEGLAIAITGGARGIGLATAGRLAAAGARVAIGDLDGEAARAAAARIGAAGFELDVTSTPSFTAFLDAAERELGGPLDVLVNNAAVMWVGPFDEEPEEVAARQLEVNVLGVIRGTRLATARMAPRRHGQVLTIASAASKLAPKGEATYAATKHAVHGYLSAVRMELRGRVEISMVLPGVVDTQLAAGTRTGPIRRLKPDDVAGAVLRAIERPRFETVVPRRIALVHAAQAVLPQPARDALLRVLLPDQVAAVRKKGGERAAYERASFERRS